jgi:hypothetical protein
MLRYGFQSIKAMSSMTQRQYLSSSCILSSSCSIPFTWQEEKGGDQLSIDPSDVFRAGVRHHHICNTAFPIAHKYVFKLMK